MFELIIVVAHWLCGIIPSVLLDNNKITFLSCFFCYATLSLFMDIVIFLLRDRICKKGNKNLKKILIETYLFNLGLAFIAFVLPHLLHK